MLPEPLGRGKKEQNMRCSMPFRREHTDLSVAGAWIVHACDIG
jgi:hypothetical protein